MLWCFLFRIKATNLEEQANTFSWEFNFPFSLNAKELFDENGDQVWWGPKNFCFNNVAFYLMVYKKFDERIGEVR